jgi:hypothetical protein
MKRLLVITAFFIGARAMAQDFIPNPEERDGNYKGECTTQALYTMCSSTDATVRKNCNMYLEGLMYGLKVQKYMEQEKQTGKHKIDMSTCLPEITVDQARERGCRSKDGWNLKAA